MGNDMQQNPTARSEPGTPLVAPQPLSHQEGAPTKL